MLNRIWQFLARHREIALCLDRCTDWRWYITGSEDPASHRLMQVCHDECFG